MKIAVRGGHNPKVTGAHGIIDELTEDRRVCAAVVKYLKILNQNVMDVTPQPMSRTEDLAYGVNKATAFGADLFVSIHFNNAYSSYNGALGTETWLNLNNSTSKAIATRITASIAKLGFKNRGIKDGMGRGLYEVKKAPMSSMIVEVCFVEAKEDVKLYNKLGPDLIGKTIAEAIVGKSIGNNKEPEKDNTTETPKDRVNYCLEFQKWYNEVTNTKEPLVEDGICGSKTINGMNILNGYIKKGREYKYCLEFQKWYNDVTKTKAPIATDGIYGPETEAAAEKMYNLVKKS